MGSSDRLFNRQRTVHEILGGGLAADVMLWRRKHLTVGILLVILAAWIVFEKSGYTLLSYVSSVFLLLFTILFLWSKSATILNRPLPPLPNLYLSEEMVNEAAALVRNHVNMLLSIFGDIALGKDSRLFAEVACGLLLIAVIGSLTDLLTLVYTTVVIVLVVPALYERYENHIDTYILTAWRKLQQLYSRFGAECVCKVQKLILGKKKLS